MQNQRSDTSNVIPFDGENDELEKISKNSENEIQKDPFDRLVSQYCYAKSIEQDTSTLDFAQELDRSSEELAFEILTKPASAPRQVLIKLNILENELALEIEAGMSLDARSLVMFAGLKADLIKLIAQVDMI